MILKKHLNPFTAWLLVILCMLFYMLDYFQHTAPSVLIHPIAQSLHVHFTTIGNIMSLYFPIYALCQIPAGTLLDRFGLKHTLSLACLFMSFGLLMMTQPIVSFIVIGRIVIAAGSAFAFLGALKAASLWISTSLFPFSVGLINTAGVVGGILGQPFLSYLITELHWSNALVVIASAGILLALCLYFFLPRQLHPFSHSTQPLSLNHLLKTKPLWLLNLYAGIMVGVVVNAVVELYGIVFLQQTTGLSSITAASVNSITFVGIAVGAPIHGILAQFFKAKRQ